MSFIPNDNQNQQAPQGQTTPNPLAAGAPPPQSGGSTGTGATGTSKTGVGAATGSPTQFGSSASKLGDYLTANAPQIGAQSQQVVNNLNTQYGRVQGDITNAANQFGQAVSAGYAAPNQDIVNQAVANPTAFVQNPNDVSAFQAQYNNQYTGPQNFESTSPYSQIQGEVSNAVQNANLLQSPAGLQSYLGQNQTGNATRASNTLDALLLQGNPESQANIQKAAGQFQGLTDQFGNAVTQGNALVPAAQQAAKNAQQYAQGQFGNAVTGFNTNLQAELDAANAANSGYNTNVTNLRSQLQSGQLPTGMGIDQNLVNWENQYVQPLYNQGAAYLNIPQLNLLNAMGNNTNPEVPTLGSVASQNDYATLAALNQLTGNDISSPLSASTSNLAGAYQAPTIGNLNNQAIAQDYLNQMENASGDTTPLGNNYYENYLGRVARLGQYLHPTDTNYDYSYMLDPNNGYYTKGPGKAYLPPQINPQPQGV